MNTEALYALALNLQLIGVPGLITSMRELEYSFLSFLTVFVFLELVSCTEKAICTTALLYLSVLRDTLSHALLV